MVTASTKKLRDWIAIALLAYVGIRLLLAFIALLTADGGFGFGFAEKAYVIAGAFTIVTPIVLVAGAVVLVTHLGEPSKLARVLTIVAMAELGVMLLLGLVAWIAGLTTDNADQLGTFGSIPLAGKAIGGIDGFVGFLLIGLALYFCLVTFNALPKPVRQAPAWGGGQPGWGPPPGQPGQQGQHGWGAPGPQPGQQPPSLQPQGSPQTQGQPYGQQGYGPQAQPWGQPDRGQSDRPVSDGGLAGTQAGASAQAWGASDPWGAQASTPAAAAQPSPWEPEGRSDPSPQPEPQAQPDQQAPWGRPQDADRDTDRDTGYDAGHDTGYDAGHDTVRDSGRDDGPSWSEPAASSWGQPTWGEPVQSQEYGTPRPAEPEPQPQPETQPEPEPEHPAEAELGVEPRPEPEPLPEPDPIDQTTQFEAVPSAYGPSADDPSAHDSPSAYDAPQDAPHEETSSDGVGPEEPRRDEGESSGWWNPGQR